MDRPPQPSLAELLSRCDFARLHPDRLRRNTERWELEERADTEGVRSGASSTDEEDE